MKRPPDTEMKPPMLHWSASFDRTQVVLRFISNLQVQNWSWTLNSQRLAQSGCGWNSLPPGRQNSCDPSRLWKTDRSLVRSARCRSAGCSTCPTNRPISKTNRNFIHIHNIPHVCMAPNVKQYRTQKHDTLGGTEHSQLCDINRSPQVTLFFFFNF